MTARLRVLFVCSQNRLRSPTAEAVFAADPGLEARSAGTDPDAPVPVTREILAWADVVLVMERRHRNRIHARFPDLYDAKPIHCLYIPDEYDFMDPALVRLLEVRVPPLLDVPADPDPGV